MAEVRQRDEWARTSAVLAFLAEPHRDRKKRKHAFTPRDFDPFAQPAATETRPIVGISALKCFLPKSKPPAKQTSAKRPRKDSP